MARSPASDHTHSHRLDVLGLAISGICLVHCLLLPVAALLVPAMAWGADHDTDHRFHWLLLGLAAPISSLALWRGAVRSGNFRWLIAGSVGLLLMLIGVLHLFGAASEVGFTMAGVSLLAVAHIRNFQLTFHGWRHSFPIQEHRATMSALSIEDES
jgi:hypothetical protein